jgi:hypothetical protein
MFDAIARAARRTPRSFRASNGAGPNGCRAPQYWAAMSDLADDGDDFVCKESTLKEQRRLRTTEDAAEGVRGFVEKRPGNFQGK